MPSDLAIWCIKIYQYNLKGLFATGCYFYPSCSEYAVLQIKKRGVFRSLVRVIWRILRCHPIGKKPNEVLIDRP